MNRNDFKQALINNFNIDDIEKVDNQFEIYKQALVRQNKVMNLTRLDNDDLIYEQYFFNSLIPFKNIDMNQKKILDIGSGSGIPGIALKIIFPSLKLTILEANSKRINFMQTLATALGFNDVIFLCQRAEAIMKEQKEKYDIVTSRAVAKLGILAEISSPYLKLNGLMIEPKSINYEAEWNDLQIHLVDYGLTLIEIKKIDDKNVVFYFKKNQPTNKLYPRAWTQIIKEYK